MIKKTTCNHLIQINDLDLDSMLALLDQAQLFINQKKHLRYQDDRLKDVTLVNLFFETSTRTRISFELAAKRLGAEVINFDVIGSSTQKGESLLDTIYTLESMNCQIVVIRHPENGIPGYIAQHVAPSTIVINAGDGSHQHPTQALLDILTIRQHKKRLTNLSIAIVGDILHSRVARSQVAAMKLLGITDIRLIGPVEFFPTDLSSLPYESNMGKGLEGVDVIILLRIQKERMVHATYPDETTYFAQYGLSAEKLAYAKPDAIVMHPGPINRNIEISSEIADSPQSVIYQQVTNGIAIRMAVLNLLMHSK